MRALAEPTGRTPQPTWPPPGLVLLPENRAGWLAIKRLARNLSARRCTSFNPLVLHGPSGSGKTLLVDSLHEYMAPFSSVTRIAAADWLPHDEPGKHEDFRACDLLILEDVQYLPPRLAADLARVLDYRLARRQTVIVTASSGPARLNLPGRLRNRLAGGLVVGLRPLSPPSRVQLLRKLAQERQVTVDPDGLAWLAHYLAGSGRQLSAAIDRLAQRSEERTQPLARTAVIDAFPDLVLGRSPALERITRHVGRSFRIPVKELRGRDRRPNTLWPRQLSMYLARTLTKLSLAQIGEYFGRDHSTVRHACQRVAARATQDAELPSLLRQLSAELQ